MKGLETLLAIILLPKGRFKRTFIYSLGSKMLGETECGIGRQSGSWDARDYEFEQTYLFHWLGLWTDCQIDIKEFHACYV